MSDLLDDRENLVLLESLVSGDAVSVNFSALSKILDKHRNTIKKKVEEIFDHRIIDRPICPFLGLYKVYPLLAVVRMNLPEDENFVRWVKEDPHIFAAFRSRQGEYDTLLFIYQQSITSYQMWMESLPSILKLNYGISEKDAKLVSSTAYFSNQLMVKYDPSSGISLMERDFKEKGELTINEHEFDEIDLKIIRCLVSGEGIKISQTLLCQKTGLHRKTVEKRIGALLKEGLISEPMCRFPNFFVPPNYVLTYSLFDIKDSKEKVIQEIRKDPHVPIAIRIIHERYNLLLFGNHRGISDHLRWEEGYRKRFPDSFGSANITYLSPEMTISFDQQIVSLSIFKDRLERSRGRELRKRIQSIRD
ncbi:MAG: winged helix-turn-helix domain-containing protein [Candidatus Bathyarchaeota archaeon]|nr:winged helix-turn-helix domain-containing protein [Candidatus Bathyarchaeota archaeon]